MVQDGLFGPEGKRSNGRPKWRLVDENLGHELDISSMYCIPLKSKAMKRTEDANKEEWDILEGAAGLKSCDVPIGDAVAPVSRPIRKQPMRARTAIKPMIGKIAVIKPINLNPAPVKREKVKGVAPSPVRPTRNTPVRSPRRIPLWSPSKRTRSTPPRVSPRWTPTKRQNADEMEPPRKARKLNSSGARRTVLQS
jgi:hypothetical protein